MILIFCLSTLIVGAIADDWRYIKVPCNYQYQPITNFSKEKFSGLWYQQLRSPNPFEPSTVCSLAKLKLNPNDTLTINLPGLNTITGFDDAWGGLLTSKVAPDNSDLYYQFPENAGLYTHVVLYTDYTHCAVVLVLDDLRNPHCSGSMNAYLWIATRQPKIKKQCYEHALRVIRKNNLPTNSLYPVEQNNC